MTPRKPREPSRYKLSDTEVRQFKPAEKPYRKNDGAGLVLLIQPTGAKWWRFRYYFQGKAKMIGLGTYPRVSLSEARVLRDECFKKLTAGIDPSQDRAAQRQAVATVQLIELNTFEAIATEWYGRHAPTWAPAHAKRVKERLDNHVLPYLGDKPITAITAPMVLEVLRRMESVGKLETAHKTKQSIGQVFRYAIAIGKAETDPTPGLKGALPPTQVEHFPALLDPIAIGAVLRQFDGYGGYPPVRAGLRLGPMLFCRPGELRQMKWADLDLQAGEWRFTLSKTRQAHIVPLSKQAVAIITAMIPLTGHGIFVMPSQRSPTGERPMSDAAITAAYRALGIEQDVLVAHGWRATARTLLVEQLKFPVDQVEQQLGHQVKDALGRAYNRTTFLEERKGMMQAWSDYLDTLKNSTA